MIQLTDQPNKYSHKASSRGSVLPVNRAFPPPNSPRVRWRPQLLMCQRRIKHSFSQPPSTFFSRCKERSRRSQCRGSLASLSQCAEDHSVVASFLVEVLLLASSPNGFRESFNPYRVETQSIYTYPTLDSIRLPMHVLSQKPQSSFISTSPHSDEQAHDGCCRRQNK